MRKYSRMESMSLHRINQRALTRASIREQKCTSLPRKKIERSQGTEFYDLNQRFFIIRISIFIKTKSIRKKCFFVF